MISRRAFLRSALITSTGLSVGLAARDLKSDGYSGTAILEEVSIRIPELPAAFLDYRIGFITDIHLGIWVPEEWLERALDTLAKHRVDLLILGGDYVYVHNTPLWNLVGCVRDPRYSTISKRAIIDEAFHGVGRIVSRYTFPDGTLGVVGNHEHWNSIGFFYEAMRSYPTLKFLINQEVTIQRGGESLSVVGVDDFLTGLPIAPPPKQPKTPRVLVSHNPDYVATLVDKSPLSFDLALCGHTHGGQICLPGLNDLVVPVQDPRFISGLSDLGHSAVYTSRGLGVVGLPFRVNCPPEVTILHLTR